MISILHFIRPLLAAQLVLAGFTAAAKDVFIPDSGLNAAIRETLQKPNAPLSQQDLLSLTSLNASGRRVSSLEGLQEARNLTVLNLQSNRLATLSFPAGLTRLSVLDLSFNPLTNCIFPLGLTNLSGLAIEEASLTSLTLPADMTGLNNLDLFGNQLTNFTLPAGLTNLSFLDLDENRLPNLDLPAGLTSLALLTVSDNQLLSLTLPADMTNLSSLFLDGNPFTALVLSEPLAAIILAELTVVLDGQSVSVFTYPLTTQLVAPRQPGDGSFQFALTGPPGVYVVLASTNLVAWSELAFLTNQIGTVRFEDVAAPLSSQKFYAVRSF